jgi:hypothetical protein
MSEDFLAESAADDVLFPGIHFRGEKRAFVISGKRFRVGTRIAVRASASGTVRSTVGSRRRTQMARNRFVKIPIAFVRRHGLLHP